MDKHLVEALLGFLPDVGGIFVAPSVPLKISDYYVCVAICEHEGCYGHFIFSSCTDFNKYTAVLDVFDSKGWGIIYCPEHKDEAKYTSEQMRKGYGVRK